MKVDIRSNDNRTFKNNGVRSLFDTEVNIKIRVLTIVALAGAVGNTLGFLANLFLYGFNAVTGFCALCALLIILNLFFGLRSKYSISFGFLMLFILDVLEFPLLTLTYGAVMYPYMIIGFHALVMITDYRKRTVLSILLGIYDVAIIVYSSINPYIFGPQDSIGLLGSAVITFIISLITVASLVIMWQNVYLIDTIEIDPITKVQSQAGFIKNAQKILQSNSGTEYLLLYFNIFSFKAINSIYGIEGGNRVLHTVAESLSKSDFAPRLLGRLNADRFVCLVEKEKFNKNALTEICHVPYEENGRKILVNIHCGIYEIKDKTIPVASMIDRANTAIKFVHAEGNKHYAFYNSRAEEAYNEETTVLAEIDDAIQKGQFSPYYQPIIDCSTRKIVSAEALARWIHPELGIISPSVFIPILEKKNLISVLDSIMAKGVNSFISGRVSKQKNIVPISINLSRDDLYDSKFMHELKAMLSAASSFNYLHRFEITESAYEDMSEHTLDALSELRKNDSAILVDDFGSGYSSLGMITDYAFDIIKLDIQFASKIAGNNKIQGVVQSIIDMAHKLGAKVIAEGIENEEQYIAVKECGCDFVQGYYFYKAMPENEFAALLDSQQ